MQRQDIISLEENTAGKDYIMADLHGNANCLEAKLKQLQPEDRLFIAGDLTDRGTDSPRVIRLILEYQAKHPDKLYIVCGNHEEVNAEAIGAMADYFEELSDIPYSAMDPYALDQYANEMMSKKLGFFKDQKTNLHLCLLNGGFWLLELFRQEMLQKRLYISKSNSLASSKSLVADYHTLVSNLPTIIYVKGKRPFTVVHADMPISHQDMLARLERNETTLSDEEREHALNARTPVVDAAGLVINTNAYLVKNDTKFPFLMITYCGHNIINNLNTFVTRPATDTVVLDALAWRNNAALVACHSDSTCEYVGPAADTIANDNAQLWIIQQELSIYLQAVAARYQSDLENVDSINTPEGTPSKRLRSPTKSPLTKFTLTEERRALKSPKKQLKMDDSDIANTSSPNPALNNKMK